MEHLRYNASRAHFGDAKAEEIRAAVQNSFGIAIAISAFALQLRQLLEMIDLLDRQLDELDFKVQQRMNKLDACITICLGVGKVLGATILSEIGDISRFPESKKLVAFVSIDPCVHCQRRSDFVRKGGTNNVGKW